MKLAYQPFRLYSWLILGFLSQFAPTNLCLVLASSYGLLATILLTCGTVPKLSSEGIPETSGWLNAILATLWRCSLREFVTKEVQSGVDARKRGLGAFKPQVAMINFSSGSPILIHGMAGNLAQAIDGQKSIQVDVTLEVGGAMDIHFSWLDYLWFGLSHWECRGQLRLRLDSSLQWIHLSVLPPTAMRSTFSGWLSFLNGDFFQRTLQFCFERASKRYLSHTISIRKAHELYQKLSQPAHVRGVLRFQLSLWNIGSPNCDRQFLYFSKSRFHHPLFAIPLTEHVSKAEFDMCVTEDDESDSFTVGIAAAHHNEILAQRGFPDLIQQRTGQILVTSTNWKPTDGAELTFTTLFPTERASSRCVLSLIVLGVRALRSQIRDPVVGVQASGHPELLTIPGHGAGDCAFTERFQLCLRHPQSAVITMSLYQPSSSPEVAQSFWPGLNRTDGWEAVAVGELRLESWGPASRQTVRLVGQDPEWHHTSVSVDFVTQLSYY